MKIICITQARFGSSRFPGKILKEINGKTLLQIHLERAGRSKRIDKLIVATTLEREADRIVEIAELVGCMAYRGALDDVLDRFYQAARTENPDYVVRITSDCPLIDPMLIDEVIDAGIKSGYDYFSNVLAPSFPDGMDIEVFKFFALKKAWEGAVLSSEREHVTSHIWKNSSFFNKDVFSSGSYSNVHDYSSFRLTVDEQPDFELISRLVKDLGDDKSWLTYVEFLEANPRVKELNTFIQRNEGLMKSEQKDSIKLNRMGSTTKSDAYRKEIHDLIPGGAHTYSKGDDQFPLIAPAAIDKGNGAWVWDVDGNKFLDCSMGLSSVTLGHAFQPVLERVKKELDKGVNFQRPSYIEKEMAESFLSLVPYHDMVKFAKNGSSATTAAVKLARAFTGRKLVVFPGDHPFYSYDDWFIGTTASNRGVPDEFTALSATFLSCNIESLKELFSKYPGQIACVITEPEKFFCANNCACGSSPEKFLKEAIELTHKNGAIFILDEMVTGFKTAFPGSMTKYGLTPDMATWGKGIANGFSFCALTGKKEIMELGGIRKKGTEKLFLISTTHGGETHSIAAGLATIDFYKKNKVIEKIHETGKQLVFGARNILTELKLVNNIEVTDSYWMPLFIFKNNRGEIDVEFKTFFLQEMIRNGVLFQGIFVPSFSHNENEIKYFFEAFRASALEYKSALLSGCKGKLIGEPIKPVFRKYI